MSKRPASNNFEEIATLVKRRNSNIEVTEAEDWFPTNGDIRISIGPNNADKLILHKSALSKASAYFTKFEAKG